MLEQHPGTALVTRVPGAPEGAVADVVEETVEAAGCCLVGWAVSGQTYNGSFSKLTIIMSKADDVADICRKG